MKHVYLSTNLNTSLRTGRFLRWFLGFFLNLPPKSVRILQLNDQQFLMYIYVLYMLLQYKQFKSLFLGPKGEWILVIKRSSFMAHRAPIVKQSLLSYCSATGLFASIFLVNQGANFSTTIQIAEVLLVVPRGDVFYPFDRTYLCSPLRSPHWNTLQVYSALFK